MPSYGQFCPVAKAMELLDERWTVLVVRELAAGSQHFNELRRGVPRMSPALLSKRLRTLQRAGIVDRVESGRRVSYSLTPAGEELRPIVEALGAWGVRWIPELGDEDLDPHLLLWDIHRNLDVGAMPAGRTVLRVLLTDAHVTARSWWIVVVDDDVDLCDVDPGYAVDVTMDADLRILTLLWRGDVSWDDAVRAGRVTLHGPTALRRAVPRWLKRSSFATVPRPLVAHPDRPHRLVDVGHAATAELRPLDAAS